MGATDRARRIYYGGRGAFNSAFSVGEGYEHSPFNPLSSYTSVERYFLDYRAKTDAGSGKMLTGLGSVLPPSAVTVAQRALGWWERHLNGEPMSLPLFLSEVDALLDAAERVEGLLLWRYDVPVPKYHRAPPWYSSMAQGQAASALTRAYLATGDDTYAQAALSSLAPLRPPGDRGLVTQGPAGPIFEECPSDPPSHILNGWVFTLWGLWDVITALDASQWQSVFDASCSALTAELPRYDVGWWTRYSLYPRQEPDLAKPAYHALHADQLDVMARLVGDPEFREASLRWRSYDTPLHRARAVASKGSEILRHRILGS